jgi:hypothetical protein
MKKLITSTLFLICASIAVAQTTTDDYYQAPKSNFLSKDKVSGSVSMGAGVSFLNSTKNTAFTTFIAPKIGYQLTNKFKLNVGLMHYTVTGNTFMPMNQNEAFLNSGNKTVSGNLIFAEGQYQLNKKVILSAAVMTDVNSFSNKQNNYKAISLGMDYKVTEHSTIGFRANVSQGNSPYSNNRIGGSSFGTYPMMQDMFGTGFGQDFHSSGAMIR